MYQDYKDLLSAFHAHGVKYPACGRVRGYLSRAAALHEGHGPFRKSGPRKRAGNLCGACQFWRTAARHPPGGFHRPQQVYFRFGREPKGIDILPAIPGVDFDAAWERRLETTIDTATGQKAFFISADDLIASKLASGRTRDLADAEDIRKARESQQPQPEKRTPPEAAPNNGPNQ